jgi:hypothetical protein
MEVSKPDHPLKEARDLAWNHFDLHAKQRMEMFRSYVTFIAIIYAGYGATLQSSSYFIGGALSLLAIFLSVVFFLFDLRIRQLLKISERYLIDEEKRLSESLHNANIRLFRKADMITHIGGSYFKLTYSTLFRGIYLANVLIAVAFILFLIIVASR